MFNRDSAEADLGGPRSRGNVGRGDDREHAGGTVDIDEIAVQEAARYISGCEHGGYAVFAGNYRSVGERVALVGDDGTRL